MVMHFVLFHTLFHSPFHARSLTLYRSIGQWTVNTHTLNLSTFNGFISTKSRPKIFKATGENTTLTKNVLLMLSYLFRLVLLMAVVSYVIIQNIKTMQLEYLMQNFHTKMISQGIVHFNFPIWIWTSLFL